MLCIFHKIYFLNICILLVEMKGVFLAMVLLLSLITPLPHSPNIHISSKSVRNKNGECVWVEKGEENLCVQEQDHIPPFINA